MSQYRDYTQAISITDDTVTIVSRYGTHQLSTSVDRDASEETNFKVACWAHRSSVVSLPPSSTAPASYVVEKGRWVRSIPSGTVSTSTSTTKVPAGNSGILVVVFDDDSFDTYYKIGAGSFTAISSGGTLTVADDNLLSFKVEGLTEQYSINGTVTDQDTGVLVDNISLMNTAIAP